MAESTTERSKHEIIIRQEWCKGCRICVDFCKPQVLQMEGLYPVVVNADACTGCLQCELLCPDFAIAVD